jgi:glycosyltransferase involved in cell wall biosynthesis
MVSLVVATFNRVTELRRLLESLDLQTYKNFELIVVDQNPDDRLVPVLERHTGLNIVHVRSGLGVSKARNVGIRIAKGEILSFPDDDCWYPAELLSNVVQWLESNPEFDGIFTATRDQNDRLQAPKFPPKAGPCTKRSVLRCAVAFNAFLKVRVVKGIGFFREDIGPGTSSPYQSSEDIDYMIRPLDRGMSLFYQPAFTVYHPNFNDRNRLRRTTFRYSLGQGYILRLHGYSWLLLGEVLGRSLAGAVVKLMKGDLEGSYLYCLRASGQLQGYLSPIRDTSNAVQISSAGGDK